ncbi:dienelactone hydrolase family protein [Advenella sp. WQ 585]|uniref:Dienelactone hydrolase family protein n=1 Tax=Advenella mandrilli TaxID=2800330 RepID=A0ABS1E9B2_9BURK|nr:dienelactone hydrolase family protein [Advenella mandrilli]MBK1780304.1 dienelactone hydrolase family protein [Advenella mandrilli]
MYMTLRAEDGHVFDAYVTGEETARAGIVLIQEIFGVNSHIRDVAGFFAAQGYRVVAPALFDRVQAKVELGYAQQDIQKGLELRSEISQEQVMMDIAAAVQALEKQSSVGVVGYCWGGTLAWLAASEIASVNAASCWYGGGLAQVATEQTAVPVQMHFGELDKSIPLSDIEIIRQAQPDAEMFVYPGVDHGFGCDQRGSYNQAATELARQRTLSFFAKHL